MYVWNSLCFWSVNKPEVFLSPLTVLGVSFKGIVTCRVFHVLLFLSSRAIFECCFGKTRHSNWLVSLVSCQSMRGELDQKLEERRKGSGVAAADSRMCAFTKINQPKPIIVFSRL